MKRTKNFFIALLGFCLMGSGVADAQQTPIFVNIDNLTYVVYDEANRLAEVQAKKEWNGYDAVPVVIDGLLKIADKVNVDGVGECVVKKIKDSGFAGQTKITSLDLPSSVTIIGENAFKDCTSITSLDLSYVSTIGKDAFYSCTNLGSLKVGNIASKGAGAFEGTNIKNLEFADNLTSVPASITSGFAAKLTDVTLHDNIKSIGEEAFMSCSNLTSINLNKVTSIGKKAFASSGLNQIFSYEVITIGESAFEGCSNLRSANFPALSTLSNRAFASSGIVSFVVPDNVTSLPSGLFNTCKSLTTVTWNNVVSIGAEAFESCTSLEQNGMLEFPRTLQSIADNAFSGTNFAGAYFSAVPEIQTDAFYSKTLVLRIADATAVKYYSTSATFDRVEYTRSAPGNYAAIALPFDFEKGGNTYYELTSFDLEGGMHFTEVETPVANTPYLYQGSDGVIVSSGTYSPSANDDGDVAVSTGVEDWEAVCVYKDHSTQSGDPIIEGYYKWAVQGGSLKYFNGQMYMKPYRAYWRTNSSHVSQNARVFVHTRDGNVTSINMAEIDGWENMVPVYYDLTGRMVNNPVKGNIYIVNGKKVVF